MPLDRKEEHYETHEVTLKNEPAERIVAAKIDIGGKKN